MTLSIVTLFNKKAEPAELDFWGFGVRKNVAGSEFGTRVRRTESLIMTRFITTQIAGEPRLHPTGGRR